MRRKIIAGILTGILALALIMLAVPLHYLTALASPLGLIQTTFTGLADTFEADVTGCGNWRDDIQCNDYLHWNEALNWVSPTPANCVWHYTSGGSASWTEMGLISMAIPDWGG